MIKKRQEKQNDDESHRKRKMKNETKKKLGLVLLFPTSLFMANANRNESY